RAQGGCHARAHGSCRNWRSNGCAFGRPARSFGRDSWHGLRDRLVRVAYRSECAEPGFGQWGTLCGTVDDPPESGPGARGGAVTRLGFYLRLIVAMVRRPE